MLFTFARIKHMAHATWWGPLKNQLPAAITAESRSDPTQMAEQGLGQPKITIYPVKKFSTSGTWEGDG